MATKIKYSDIKLGDKVQLPKGYRHLCNGYGDIAAIDNMALLDGIDEPIFKVNSGKISWIFGLKYVTKNILKN